MPNYVLAFHGGGGMPESEDEGARVLAAWVAWYDGLGAAVVDSGNPVGSAKTIGPDGTVSDGGGSNPVSGYSIISADDLDDAVAKAMDCPIRASGGSVEVGETFTIM